MDRFLGMICLMPVKIDQHRNRTQDEQVVERRFGFGLLFDVNAYLNK